MERQHHSLQGGGKQTYARITTGQVKDQVKAAAAQDHVQQRKFWTSGFVSDNLMLAVADRPVKPAGRCYTDVMDLILEPGLRGYSSLRQHLLHMFQAAYV